MPPFPKIVRAVLLLVLILAAPLQARADLHPERAGVQLGVGSLIGFDTDDGGDLDSTNYYALLSVAYRTSFGTEPFGAAGFASGGREGSLISLGAGLRQRFAFELLEPYVEFGAAYVSDGQAPMSLFLGAGMDVRLSENWGGGLAGGYYASDESGSREQLDWFTRVQFSYHFTL